MLQTTTLPESLTLRLAPRPAADVRHLIDLIESERARLGALVGGDATTADHLRVETSRNALANLRAELALAEAAEGGPPTLRLRPEELAVYAPEDEDAVLDGGHVELPNGGR